MDDRGLAKLLLTLAGTDGLRRDHTGATRLPTPSCPPLPRLRTGVLREDWTEAEEGHKRSCAYCQKTESEVRAAVWHPPLLSLFGQARGLSEAKDADLKHHLHKDACKRCQRLSAVFQADRILGRLATRLRQGVTDAAALLRQMLGTGVVGSVPLCVSASEQQLRFEDSRHRATLFRTDPPRLLLQHQGDAGNSPRLQRLLLGDGKECWNQFVVFRPGRQPQTNMAELRLERLPSAPCVLALYEVNPAVLDREDVPQLRENFMAVKREPLALFAWQNWAAGTLKLPGLDPALRTALEGLRPDAADSRQKLSP